MFPGNRKTIPFSWPRRPSRFFTGIFWQGSSDLERPGSNGRISTGACKEDGSKGTGISAQQSPPKRIDFSEQIDLVPEIDQVAGFRYILKLEETG